jgi:thiamine-phosphate pyrophosphorylase
VNGRLDVALAAGADGVHLQKENIPVAAVKTKYPQLKVGYSAHSLEEMEIAEREGADYLFISPVFAPLSKASSLAAHGLLNAGLWARKMKIPVFALGGVTRDRIPEIKGAGFAGAAGISFFVDDGVFTSRGMVN